MEGKRIYLQPQGTLLNAILDVLELQNGKTTYSDTPNGKVYFTIKMYGLKWELRFCVTDIGKNRCLVQLEIAGEERGKENLIYRQFALIDSMLISLAKIELAEKGDSG